jgi:hypothetical protein
MKRFKNDLGWYFYKSRSGLGIRRKDPSRKSLRNRIIKALLFWIIAAIGTYFITISKEGCPPEIALSIITILTLIVLIFSLLGKIWLLGIISLQRNTYSLVINGVVINNPRRDQRLLSYLFKTEIEHESESGLYKVYLRPSEFLDIEGQSEDFNPLVWETKDEQEASLIMEELHQCGVGEKDFEKQHPVIRRNKKAGLLVSICYIFCFIALVFYLLEFIKPEITNNPNSIKPYLHFIKAFLIFGLLSFIVYACYKIWFGLMVIKHRQIPPPKAIVFLDTRLYQGEKAVKRGKNIVAFGIITIVISLTVAIYADYKLKAMIPSQNNQQILTTDKNQ